jgi:hypothetical protein
MSVQAWYFGAGVKRLADSMDKFENYDVFIEPDKGDGPFVEKKRNKHKVVPLIPFNSPNRIQYGGQGDFRRLCMDKITEGFIEKIVKNPKYSEWHVLSPLQNSDEFVVTGVAYSYPLQLGPMLVNDPLHLIFHIPNSLKTTAERQAYRIDNKKKLMNLYRSFNNALYIELLCSPVEKNGASDALFDYIETFYSHKYDAIFLKSVSDTNTLACYTRNGFKKEFVLGGRDDDLYFMYKPLQSKRMRISERKSYDL